MKGCILEAYVEEKVWKTTLFTILLALIWELRYFWNWGNIIKMMCWNRRFKHLSTLPIGVSKKFHLNFSLCLAIILQNGAKFIQKLTPDFKNHIRDLDNFRQAVKRPTSKRLMDYIPSAKNLNTEDLFKITFNYFVKIHQISDVIFEIISHFHDATSVYFFSSNITYFLQK